MPRPRRSWTNTKPSKRTTSGQQQQQQPGGSTDSAPAADGANSEAKPQPTDDIDEAAWRQDRDTREAILHLLRSHSGELSRGTEREADRSNNATKSPRNTRRNSPEPEREYKSSKNHRLMQELDEMDIEEDKRNLITREIDKFRDTYKKQQEEDRDRERERRRERKERRDRERSPDRSSRARDRERTTRDSAKEDRADERSSRDRDRESSREPKPSSSDSAQPASSSQPPPSRSDRAPSKARSESPERDWVRERERERERELREVMRPRDAERDWEREREEEEEAYERKKLERKLREKEAAYQERLRNWEARERRKAKEYEKERLKEEEKLAEEAKEARRLKEFLEDYEDERDDVKYYKGAALQRRMKDREKEIELDNRDRQREREELEDLQVKLKAEGHPDPVAEAKRIHHEEEVRLLSTQPHLVPVVRPEPPEPEPEPTRGGRNHPSSPPPARRPSQHSRALPQSPKAEPRSPPPRRESSSTRRTRSPSPVSAAPPVVKVEEDGSGQNSLSGFSDVATPQEEGRSMGFGVLKLGGSPGQTSGRKSPTSSSKRKKLSAAASQAFGNGEEEDSAEARKKRKLVPLEDEEAHKQLDPQQQQQVQHMNTGGEAQAHQEPHRPHTHLQGGALQLQLRPKPRGQCVDGQADPAVDQQENYRVHRRGGAHTGGLHLLESAGWQCSAEHTQRRIHGAGRRSGGVCRQNVAASHLRNRSQESRIGEVIRPCTLLLLSKKLFRDLFFFSLYIYIHIGIRKWLFRGHSFVTIFFIGLLQKEKDYQPLQLPRLRAVNIIDSSTSSTSSLHRTMHRRCFELSRREDCWRENVEKSLRRKTFNGGTHIFSPFEALPLYLCYFYCRWPAFLYY
nr:RNA-binding protein 25-like [Rhipicephalus microplus]